MIRVVTGTEVSDRRQKGDKEDRDRNAEDWKYARIDVQRKEKFVVFKKQ